DGAAITPSGEPPRRGAACLSHARSLMFRQARQEDDNKPSLRGLSMRQANSMRVGGAGPIAPDIAPPAVGAIDLAAVIHGQIDQRMAQRATAAVAAHPVLVHLDGFRRFHVLLPGD